MARVVAYPCGCIRLAPGEVAPVRVEMALYKCKAYRAAAADPDNESQEAWDRFLHQHFPDTPVEEAMKPRDIDTILSYIEIQNALNAALACIAKIQVHCELAAGRNLPSERIMDVIDTFLHIAASGSEVRFRELRDEFRRQAERER